MTGKLTPEPTDVSRPFWDAVQQRRLILQRCAKGHFTFYPRIRCSTCGTRELEWAEASGAGEVYSYSVVHHAPTDSYVDDVPYVVALIKLSEGPKMMANVVACRPSDVHVGLRVTVAFEERSGGLVMPVFVPSGSLSDSRSTQESAQ